MSSMKTGLIILAAGASSRMGQCKFLLPDRNDKPILENLLRAACEFDFTSILIVSSMKNAEAVIAIADAVAPETISVIFNPRPELERFYSLKTGLFASGDIDCCFIHNADNPVLHIETLQKLYECRDKASVIVPTFNSKGGHPVLINRSVIERICGAPVDSRLNVELQKSDVFRLEIHDPEILLDIDTEEDYNRYLHHELDPA